MKKNAIVGIIIAIGIVIIGGYYTYSHFDKTSNNNPKAVGSLAINNNSNTQKVQSTKVSFSKTEVDSYYKLSQVVGDIGLPSASMTTNINLYNTINGVNYYKAYSYDTRAAYNNDNTTEENGNYSHLSNVKIVSLEGQTLTESEFGKLNTKNLTSQDKTNQIYKIASMYVEGYTANNPNLVINANDNYEGNLNAEPTLNVTLGNTKTVNNETLYRVTVNINNNEITMYVGLDGYIYISSQNDFNKIFFPNKVEHQI